MISRPPRYRLPPIVSRLTLLVALLIATLPPAVSGAEPSRPYSWTQGNGFRFTPLQPASGTSPGLPLLLPRDSNVTFSNRLSLATVATNRLLEIGSGVTLGDVDGDGWTDLYFCGLDNDNVLYRNLGNGRFENITTAAGVACSGQWSTGCVLVDLDDDQDLDLLVSSLGGGTRLFRNQGNARFKEDLQSGLFRRYGATSLALADLEGDGDLDLYVTHYRTDTFLDHPAGLRPEMRRRPDGSQVMEPADRFLTLTSRDGLPLVIERGEMDVFYINRGGGRFVPVPWQIGVFRTREGGALTVPPTDWGLAVLFRDLNGDRNPDLYVCNDFIHWPDRVWLNQDGRYFIPAPPTMFRTFSLASMAADAADINRDGLDDLFVADMLSPRRSSRAWQRPDTLQDSLDWPVHDPQFQPEVPRNTLHLARHDGTYAEIARLAGVAATDWTPNVAFLDVDLDGWDDLLTTAGNLHDVQDLDALTRLGNRGAPSTPERRLQERSLLPPRALPSLAFRNQRDLTFEDASHAWGFDITGVAHGLALGDLDNDGDLDPVINCMNGPARIHLNAATAPRLAVRLRGVAQNAAGVGAVIRVVGGPVPQSQQVVLGGRYCSSDDPLRVFATGDALTLRIEVTWRSGRHSLVDPALPNHLYEIHEATASDAPSKKPEAFLPLFEDLSANLAHIHMDEPFDDVHRQPLLPNRLSTLGPGVASSDLDADGDPDLMIATGRGGRTAVFLNEGSYTFRAWPALPQSDRDQSALLVAPRRSEQPRLIVGESNWEDANPNAPAFKVLSITTNDPGDQARSTPPSGTSSTGPLAMGDVDGDGILDLFVGGRTTPGRDPQPADSLLLLGHQDGFRLARRFPALGRISGAVFADLDADGDPDLALAGHWDPIRILRNEGGDFIEVTQDLGLDIHQGWWNGIAAGDFDGDGLLDLVASNWGRNGRLDASPPTKEPVLAYVGEFADDGRLHTLIASRDPFLNKVTPWRERKALVAALPSLAARLPTYHAYGAASVDEILGTHMDRATRLSASTFDSMVFLNRRTRFEAVPLPVEAQFVPAFGLSVTDFDGDGHEDLFLAQGFFGVDPESSRHDAGVGLLLLGDGTGHFRALDPAESGISLSGEQRGTAVADFDGDHRPDLVVTQNRDATHLYRNRGGSPGLRISLHGSPGNPHGVGAVVRLIGTQAFGPARTVVAGSGYWSQDSPDLVLASPFEPVSLEVRWPHRETQAWPWPPGARTVVVSHTGIEPALPPAVMSP